MGIHKKYSGYRSFDYLEKGKDFKKFQLLTGESTFEPYLIPLTEEQEKRELDLARKLVMISLHEHPHLFPADIRETMAYEKEVRIFTAY